MEEVGVFYEAIDIFILASRHDEGYGLVVAESMSYGKPVVITNSGGATEIVENGVNGYIVPKQNSKKMAEKMLLLSIDHSLYLNFSSKAIERIKNDFAIEIAASRFLELLKAVE
jgi:glycosyltransferase involved in cell wall biosynthesis